MNASPRPSISDPGGWRTLLRHRELIVALAERELTLRYKRSILGLGWALAEPLVVVGVYFVVFGLVLNANRGIDNYLLFTLTGLLPWLFLSSSMEQSASALLDHAPLIRKVYFPRQILVGAVVFSRLTTLLICLAFALAIAVFQSVLGAQLAWSRVPLLLVGLVLMTGLGLGLSLGLAAMNVMLRDTAFLVRFALRLFFYACPIVYPLSLVPANARALYECNPVVGIVWLFQAFTDPAVMPPGVVGWCSAIAGPLLALGGGVILFRRLEPAVADLL